jgi:hypothetical protein
MSDSELKEKESASAKDLDAQFAPDFNPAERNRIEALNKQLGDNDKKDAPDNKEAGSSPNDTSRGGLQRIGSAVRGEFSRKHLKRNILVVMALASIGGGLLGLFGFLTTFRMDHLMSNIERQAFMRFQVDMEGRSTTWIKTYMALRMGEIEDKSVRPGDRDNIMFRAPTVGNNLTLRGWYKALRGSDFEQRVFEDEGMKFASYAYRENGMIKFRPAIVTINESAGDRMTFQPTRGEIAAIENGDINAFNGRLSQFLDVQIFNSDKEGRKAVKQIVNNNTRSYQVIKRFYLRKSIQNMTGIRDWRFFEGTRNKTSESVIAMRNKLIVKALPDSTKSGRIVQCLFGISDCRNTTTDPADPNNRATVAAPGDSCATDPANPRCNTDLDGDGRPDLTNDGSAADGITDGLGGAGQDVLTDLQKKLVTQIIGKLNIATSIVSVLDTLDHIDKAMKAGAITTMIYVARSTNDVGTYTQFNIARDQMRNGDKVSGDEVNTFTDMIAGAGTSEAWALMSESPANRVAAASFAAARDKTEYCSPEHQSTMVLPENKEIAEAEYHWVCDNEKPGGTSAGKSIEEGWNREVGPILFPILTAYHTSGAAFVTGIFNGLLDALIGGPLNALFNALGISGTIEDMIGWVVAKIAAALGAVPSLVSGSPSGVFVNHAAIGAAVGNESGLRQAGAAITNTATGNLARQKAVAYQAEQDGRESAFDKYASLTNGTSVLSRSMFAVISGAQPLKVDSLFGSIFHLPSLPLLGSQASAAADDPYALAKLGGLETYDYPSQCFNADPLLATPQNSTNADELGIIPANELNWDLVNNSIAFYDRLYADQPNSDTVKQVYNCALLDSAVRGGLGGLFSDETLGPNAYSPTGEGY